MRKRNFDDALWEAATNYVAKYNNFQTVMRERGPFSKEADEALRITVRAQTQFKRMQTLARKANERREKEKNTV